MADVNLTVEEETYTLEIDDADNVGVISVGTLGPPGPQGPPGTSRVFVQPTTPILAPGFGEYVWFKTDGSGNILQTLSGIV